MNIKCIVFCKGDWDENNCFGMEVEDFNGQEILEKSSEEIIFEHIIVENEISVYVDDGDCNNNYVFNIEKVEKNEWYDYKGEVVDVEIVEEFDYEEFYGHVGWIGLDEDSNTYFKII